MKKSGFTLIELMVVIAIIALLSMLAMPSFSRFLAKAKRTEAYMNLSSLYAAEKSYYAEHGTYTDVIFGEGGLGWKPEGYQGGGENEKFYYTYGFSGGSEGKSFFTGNLNAPSSALSGSGITTDGFIICAAADIDGDGLYDLLSVDQSNNIVIVQDDLND